MAFSTGLGPGVRWRGVSASLVRARPHAWSSIFERTSMLKGTDLTVSPLFAGLSLTLDDGARAGLVGVNGAGKTTLLRLIAGVARPERGSIALGAHDRIGYLPQDVLDPGSTIDDLLRRALGEVWEVRLELDAHEADLRELDAY